jgi:hypothetical protein
VQVEQVLQVLQEEILETIQLTVQLESVVNQTQVLWYQLLVEVAEIEIHRLLELTVVLVVEVLVQFQQVFLEVLHLHQDKEIMAVMV